MNNRETEAKFYVSDLKRLEAGLLELGATLIQLRVFETNLRFDLPDESLRAGSRVLRLRRANDVHLTYKGKSEDIEGVLSRQEIEFTVGNFESARQFLEALGFIQFAIYEKYRTTYELHNNHIMLDELPYGNFIEIEGDGVDDIRTTASRLGLNWEAAVRASYLMLFERLCKKRSLDPAKLTFAALGDFKPSPELLNVRPADG